MTYPTLPRREWVQDDEWQLIVAGSPERCRMLQRGGRCPNSAVAVFLRGRNRTQRWAYCEKHLYGRRIVNGRVEVEILVWVGV